MSKWITDEKIEEHRECFNKFVALFNERTNTICDQAKEFNRLRTRLEAAYREGWNTGYRAGLSDGNPLNSPRCDEDLDWDDSDIRKLLEGERRTKLMNNRVDCTKENCLNE